MAGGGGNDNNTELELETLGLAMFNVDADLAECFENCPEWNVSVYSHSLLGYPASDRVSKAASIKSG